MKKERKKYAIHIVLAGLCAVMAIVGIGWRGYIKSVEKKEWGELLSAKQYSRHYVMIPEDASSLMWQDIYESAKQEAADSDAYVELLADWSPECGRRSTQRGKRISRS